MRAVIELALRYGNLKRIPPHEFESIAHSFWKKELPAFLADSSFRVVTDSGEETRQKDHILGDVADDDVKRVKDGFLYVVQETRRTKSYAVVSLTSYKELSFRFRAGDRTTLRDASEQVVVTLVDQTIPFTLRPQAEGKYVLEPDENREPYSVRPPRGGIFPIRKKAPRIPDDGDRVRIRLDNDVEIREKHETKAMEFGHVVHNLWQRARQDKRTEWVLFWISTGLFAACTILTFFDQTLWLPSFAGKIVGAAFFSAFIQISHVLMHFGKISRDDQPLLYWQTERHHRG